MLSCFQSATGTQAVALPFDLARRLDDWAGFRKVMATRVPTSFTRDEWAYLIAFLDRDAMGAIFTRTFGKPVAMSDVARVESLYRPRPRTSVWLPNNVSLLGPLVLIMISLTGASVALKAGSRSDDLCQAFLDYCLQHLPAGELRNYLADQVAVRRFDRHSPENLELAQADVRIVFGSDASVAAIDSLPHPAGSVLVPFADHQSEAWAEVDALTDAALHQLIKVFSIYGTTGCTSPRRLRLIGASERDCTTVRQRLAALWPAAQRQDVAMNQASQNVAARQVMAAQGWSADLAPRNAAVLASGDDALPAATGTMTLCISACPRDELGGRLPANIQTVGHILRNAADPAWLELLAATAVKRFVPVSAMHHFSPVWDGGNFWRSLFEQVDIAS
jgi:hypothetical protein